MLNKSEVLEVAVETMRSVTECARIGYVLSIAESCIKEIKSNPEISQEAFKALDSAWAWLGGKNVSAYVLYGFLEREGDMGLAISMSELENGSTIQAELSALVEAIVYVAWNAYKKEGSRYLPQSLETVDDEDVVKQVVAYAYETETFDEVRFNRLSEFLRSEYSANDLSAQTKALSREFLSSLGTQMT